MPSELRGEATAVERVLDLLSPVMEEFRSAVATAAEEVRAFQAAHAEAAADPAGRLEKELGLFARGRIDPARLSGLVTLGQGSDPLTDHVMNEAHRLFSAIMDEGRDAFHVQVRPGGDLRDTVRDRLASLGRAFGVAHAVERARDGRYQPDRHHVLLHPYPFHRWSPLEKELAPPLVVEVEGPDFQGGGLSEFMEGWQRVVVVVRGRVQPAPLARLVSPGVVVAQLLDGPDPSAVEGLLTHLAAFQGPGIVALFDGDSGALPFIHRPGRAMEVDRVALNEGVDRVAATRGQPGILDLRHLASLVSLPGVVTPDAVPSEERRNAGQLAAWLLARTDLTDGARA